jgi:hypothetical protein
VADLVVTGVGAAPPSGVYVCQTELEAVNIALETIGEQPVVSLGGSFNEAIIAERMLQQISREVQTRGWSFNEEDEYPLVVSDGSIAVPTNILKVVVTGEQDYIVRRGDSLYNRTKHTSDFTADVKASVVLFLPFLDLPQTMRTYITLRTARKFQAKMLGAESIGKFTEVDEQQAWLALSAEEVDQGGYSISDSRLTQNRG